MKRKVNLEEISDGRLYRENDMVKADCHGCIGCHRCCTGMGNSVTLDPYDIYRLQQGLGKGLSQLLAEDAVELNVNEGVILPNMKMAGKEEQCAFLDGEGRCSIHAYRPGICRLFPLGRVFEDGDFRYFLQTGECGGDGMKASHGRGTFQASKASSQGSKAFQGRGKIKVSKWIDTPDQNRNHAFISRWHDLVNELESKVAGAEDLERAKRLNLLMLQIFYLEAYDTEQGFYEQFAGRLARYEGVFSGMTAG